MDYIVSYGSLLSRESRERYSSIFADVVPVQISGWKRGWSVRNVEERTTHAGVARAEGACMSAVLVPTRLTEDIKHRERYYDFIRLDPETISPIDSDRSVLESGNFWLCEPIQTACPSKEFPLAQTYVDTCLVGCLEAGIEDGLHQFIRNTEGWEYAWVNDRELDEPVFPRAAQLSRDKQKIIDRALAACGVLAYRRESP
ncbi:MAG: hypothetical protein AAF492_04615 [Verrucomicrobiota bacterium]